MQFFEHINYAASHEDGRSELGALRLGPDSRALCITGSGSRVLDLLVDAPREVVAIDFNPSQNRLLELKLAGMQALSYDDYARFIGLRACTDRLALYRRVRTVLPEDARSAWDTQKRAVRNGVLYCGRWERFLRLMVAPAALARRRLVRQLFDCTSVEQQRQLWLEQWNTPSWDRYLSALSNRTVWTHIVREPGMAHIPRSLDIVACIRERFDRAAGSYLFRDSAWAWLVFRGHLDPDGPLPPHLSREHFDTLRERAHTVTPVSATLEDYLLRSPAGSFDAFSVSDFGSYASDAQYASTWAAIAHAAADNARVCERQFLVPRDPLALPGLGFNRDHSLEARLRKQDTSVVYDLIVATRCPTQGQPR